MKNNVTNGVLTYIKAKNDRALKEAEQERNSAKTAGKISSKNSDANLISGKEIAKMHANEMTDSVFRNTTFKDILEAICIKLREMGVIKDDNDKTM